MKANKIEEIGEINHVLKIDFFKGDIWPFKHRKWVLVTGEME